MKKLLRVFIATLFPLAALGGTLTVNNGGGATKITSTSAWITATIVSTGAANPYLFSYWGTNDGGSNAASWLNTNAHGLSAQGAHSAQITGLSGDSVYYFRAYGSNSTSSVAWAAYSAQFRTLTTPTSAPPSSTRAVSADTNGLLKSPTNFFHTNSPQIADALSGRFSDTNAVWGNITGSLANQTDLTNAIPVVGISAGSFYDGSQGDSVSNVVKILITNTATKAQGALADSALQSETDPVWTGWVSSNGIPATGSPLYEFTETDPSYATGAVFRVDTNGWVVSSHDAFLTGEVDPAYATGAVHLAGGTMTGPLTNEYGYYGDGSGLTNLTSDPSAWSGYAATQEISWAGAPDIVPNTNVLVVTGNIVVQPQCQGQYTWSGVSNMWLNPDRLGSISWNGSEGYLSVFYGQDSVWKLNDAFIGTYSPFSNADGSPKVAYALVTNPVTWRAGYDAGGNAWAISRNGTNLQAWERGSNVLSGPVVIGGVQRDTWPAEYNDAGIGLALTNAATALSNYADSVGAAVGLLVTNSATALSNYADSVGAPGMGLLVTNAATALTNYADSVGASVGLALTNAATQATNYTDLIGGQRLPTTGGTVTGNVEVKGALIASTLRLTNAPAVGSVWVATNVNGSGELRVLAKMVMRPYGAPAYSGFFATNKWGGVATSLGGLTGTVDGIKVHRDGYYHCEMLLNIGGLTNQNQYMRAQLTRNYTRLHGQYGPMSATPNQSTISCNQGVVYPFNAGEVIGVQYYLYSSSVGQTNASDLGGFLSVNELP